METIKTLNDTDLVSKIKSLVGEEKKITQLVLEHLTEIESRRIFAARGFSSLFEFCVKELGYSESSAQRRISSMRLIKSLPEAREKLKTGEVNLSTLSQLHTFIRKEEELVKHKLDKNEKLELLKLIENKSQRECERAFVEKSPESAKIKETVRPISSELTEIKITISKELENKLAELKNLLAHQNKSNTSAELIEILADMALKKLKPTAARAVRKDVFLRDGGECQFIDPLSKRKCLSRYRIQVDHIRPKALGGKDHTDNLRLLCQTHNQLEAIRVFSKGHMRRYLPGLT